MTDSVSLVLRVTALATAILAAALAPKAGAEGFVDVGVNATNIEADIATLPETVTSDVTGAHIGGGFRRELTQGSIGVRIELDDLDGE